MSKLLDKLIDENDKNDENNACPMNSSDTCDKCECYYDREHYCHGCSICNYIRKSTREDINISIRKLAAKITLMTLKTEDQDQIKIGPLTLPLTFDFCLELTKHTEIFNEPFTEVVDYLRNLLSEFSEDQLHELDQWCDIEI